MLKVAGNLFLATLLSASPLYGACAESQAQEPGIRSYTDACVPSWGGEPFGNRLIVIQSGETTELFLQTASGPFGMGTGRVRRNGDHIEAKFPGYLERGAGASEMFVLAGTLEAGRFTGTLTADPAFIEANDPVAAAPQQLNLTRRDNIGGAYPACPADSPIERRPEPVKVPDRPPSR